MEIGTEISQKIRAAIKTKLQELGSYVDDELPDYIMVMLANKRTQDQMTEDLNLFLGSNTDKFTLWLFNLLAKLQDVTSLKDSGADGENNIAPNADKPKADLPTVEVEDNQVSFKVMTQSASRVEPVVTAMVHQQEQKAPPPTRKHSPVRVIPREAKRKSPVRTTAREELKAKPVRPGIQTEKPQVSSSVVKSVPSSSTSSSRERSLKRRKLSDSDEDEDLRSHQVPSVVKINDKPRPSIPAAKQAPSMLLKKAVAEAQLSVNRLQASSSLTYDPTSPASTPIHGYDHVEKQHKKRLLLQQHKELQKQLSEQGQLAELDTQTEQEPEPVPSEQVGAAKEEEQQKSTVEPQEPVIQLRVSEAEELELQLESGDELGKGDMRIVAFADSQAGGDDSEEEQQKKTKRRAVKSRDKPASPKFVVTLDGVDSDLEEKYDKEQRRRRRKKHRKDKDDFEEFIEVDTSDISGQAPLLPIPPQVLLPGMVPPLVLPPPIPHVLTPPAVVPEPITTPTVDPLSFKLNTASDDEGMDEAVGDQTNEKCKFWPDCRNGDDCLFYHPTVPCRRFPNCRFGDSCLFIHPLCKFDGRCANPACPYTHKTKSQVSVSPVMAPSAPVFPYPKASPPSTMVPKLCRYHPACTNSNCPFFHPRQAAKQCRYGSSCTRTDCVFSHPPAKPASGSALKWVSPSLIHISERSFAVPEESVVSLPVK